VNDEKPESVTSSKLKTVELSLRFWGPKIKKNLVKHGSLNIHRWTFSVASYTRTEEDINKSKRADYGRNTVVITGG